MARTYKRDSRGRFSGTGGAKGAYKEARSQARFEARVAAESGSGNKARINKAKKAVSAMEASRGVAGRKPAAKKAAPKAAAPKAAAPKKAASKKPSFKPSGRTAVAASDVAKSDAFARMDAGRRLKGSGKNPTARAERNLERALTSKGRKARKSEATAARAIDYMAKTGKLGKRSNGTKKRK